MIRATNPIIPSGNMRPEIRVDEGKNIRYEFNQRAESDVFPYREFDIDPIVNYGIIEPEKERYIEDYLGRTIENSNGNPSLKTYGGHCAGFAYGSIFGNSNAINNMYKTWNSDNSFGSNTNKISHHGSSAAQNNQISISDDSVMSRIASKARELRAFSNENQQSILNKNNDNSARILVGGLKKRAMNNSKLRNDIIKRDRDPKEQNIIAQIREKRNQISGSLNNKMITNSTTKDIKRQNKVNNEFEEI